MKVHQRAIPQGDTLHLEGEEDPAGLELEEAEARPLTPLRYSIDVGLSDGGLFATGSLAITLELRCVATLELFPFEVEVDDFAMQMELSGRELVDLTPYVREDILLALPAHPRRAEAVFDPEAVALQGEEKPKGPSPAWNALTDFQPGSKEKR